MSEQPVGTVATVQPGATARTRQAQAVLAVSATYAAEQEKATNELVATALLVWAGLNAKDAFGSWKSGIGERIYVLLSILMELIARDSNRYVRAILAEQDLLYLGPDIDPLNFAGIASDGRDLESLLRGAVIKVREAQRGGLSDEIAKDRGRNWLELVVRTQIADTARAAESVSLVVAEPQTPAGKKVAVGYVRMLTPPSCSRCAVLAGKFYKWNKGFERHPACDCHHIPVTVAGSNEILTNPRVYFESLSEAEQDRYFGRAQAQAIRDGADISQVVNAGRTKGSMFEVDGKRYTNEGTTKRGYARGVAGRVLRPTPWQIYRDADGDQDAARAALKRFGYTVGR